MSSGAEAGTWLWGSTSDSNGGSRCEVLIGRAGPERKAVLRAPSSSGYREEGWEVGAAGRGLAFF